MPQFELDGVGARRLSGLYRGIDIVDAVRRALDAQAEAAIDVAAPDGVAAWQDVTINGVPAGRARLHQRMRFRRD
jgi:hypothetical protein